MAATTRRAATFLVLALTALALGGCAVFRVKPAALQAGTVGDVTVHLDVCASNVGSCPATGDAEADQSAANSYDLQMLLGFLVPDGVDAPAAFDTSSGPAGTFVRNDSYSAGLGQLQAAPAGFRWVGYSTKTTYHWHYPSGPATGFTADPAFHLRPGTDGSPFHGPFTYRVVVGVRATDASHTLASALNCTGSHASTQTICSDEAAGTTPLATDISIPTRDLGVLAASAPASTTPGGAVSVPFTLRYAGAATPAASFALSAVSNVPGAAAPTLSAPSVEPATDSDSTVLATVGVPAGTAPGDYTVTLTAALPNGQSRTGTRTVTVVPIGDDTPPPKPPDGADPDTRAPVASVTIRAERLGSLIKTRKLRVRAAIDEPGTLALSTKVAGHSVRSTLSFKKSGGRTVVLRIGKAAAKALQRRSRLKLTVKASARDLAGNTTAARSSRTLRR
jgi:hypothetical protein